MARERIVFASTRGNLDSTAFDYSGPQRTPEDPSKPNANLYVLGPDPSNAGQNRVRQLTWQLNMERLPIFMQDGRLVFTVREARAGLLRAGPAAAEPRRRRLPPALLAARQHRLRAGHVRDGAVAQGLRRHLQRPERRARRRRARRLQPVHRRRLHEHEHERLPRRSTVINPSSPSASSRLLPALARPSSANDGSYTSPSALPDGHVLVSYGAGDPVDASAATTTSTSRSDQRDQDEAPRHRRHGRGRGSRGLPARAEGHLTSRTGDEPNGHTYDPPRRARMRTSPSST